MKSNLSIIAFVVIGLIAASCNKTPIASDVSDDDQTEYSVEESEDSVDESADDMDDTSYQSDIAATKIVSIKSVVGHDSTTNADGDKGCQTFKYIDYCKIGYTPKTFRITLSKKDTVSNTLINPLLVGNSLNLRVDNITREDSIHYTFTYNIIEGRTFNQGNMQVQLTFQSGKVAKSKIKMINANAAGVYGTSAWNADFYLKTFTSTTSARGTMNLSEMGAGNIIDSSYIPHSSDMLIFKSPSGVISYGAVTDAIKTKDAVAATATKPAKSEKWKITFVEMNAKDCSSKFSTKKVNALTSTYPGSIISADKVTVALKYVRFPYQ